MATTTVEVNPKSYVSLGTGPMYISPQKPILIVAAAAQPAPDAAGHRLADPLVPTPFYFSFAQMVWAISISQRGNVVVTT
jgi:hypothetical protein